MGQEQASSDLVDVLARRARQQAAVAEFGQAALAGTVGDDLFAAATERVATVLDADYASFLERVDAESLRLRAGHGYDARELGITANVTQSLAGCALRRWETIVVDDWAAETRFDYPPLLRRLGVQTSACVVVGLREAPLGALSAHRRSRSSFTVEDVAFLRSMANILGSAIARQRTEASLRASEERWQRVAEAIPQVVWTADPDGRIDFVNRRGLELLGLSPADVTRERVRDAVHPDDLRASKDAGTWARALATGEPYENVLRIRRASDGQYRWHLFRAVPLRDAAGKVVKWFGSNTDIDDQRRALEDRRRAEETLRETQRFLDHALEVGRIGTWTVLDLPQAEYAFSKEMYRIVGLPEGSRVRRSDFFALVHPEDRDALRGAASSAVARAAMLSTSFRLVRPDGTLRWLRGHAHVEHDEAGRPRLVGVTQDVTDEHLKDEQLRQAMKMEAIGRLAGGVAHDFNNLLTAINGYADLALHGLSDRDPVRRHVDEIRKAGERAGALTQQLLAFSRKQLLQPRVLNLNAVVADVERLIARVLGEHVELVCRLAPGLGNVRADAGQLEQLLMNLVVNARDAMPGGGKLTIETREVLLDAAWAAAHPGASPGAHALLAVADTGTGMDRETLSHIFEPFFTTKRGHGTGLGLSTVYGIVQQSGGTLSVETELGRGSRFEIYLPLVAEPLEAPPRSQPAVPRGTETVLLVEDEEVVRRLFSSVLKELGYRVLEAANGEEALRVSSAFAEPLDLLLTDVVMPRLGGGRLAQSLVAARPGLAVLFMSGYPDDAIVHEGVLEARSAFLQKPFSPDALARKVREVLDARRARG